MFSCEFCVSFKNIFFIEHLDDYFWICHAEFVVVSYIDYTAAMALEFKEQLEKCAYCVDKRSVDITHIAG